jgi:hypothetical protein
MLLSKKCERTGYFFGQTFTSDPNTCFHMCASFRKFVLQKNLFSKGELGRGGGGLEQFHKVGYSYYTIPLLNFFFLFGNTLMKKIRYILLCNKI